MRVFVQFRKVRLRRFSARWPATNLSASLSFEGSRGGTSNLSHSTLPGPSSMCTCCLSERHDSQLRFTETTRTRTAGTGACDRRDFAHACARESGQRPPHRFDQPHGRADERLDGPPPACYRWHNGGGEAGTQGARGQVVSTRVRARVRFFLFLHHLPSSSDSCLSPLVHRRVCSGRLGSRSFGWAEVVNSIGLFVSTSALFDDALSKRTLVFSERIAVPLWPSTTMFFDRNWRRDDNTTPQTSTRLAVRNATSTTTTPKTTTSPPAATLLSSSQSTSSAPSSSAASGQCSFLAVPGDSSLTSRSIATASSALLSSDSNQTRSSTIVGIVLAVVVALALALAFRLHCSWRRRAARKRNSTFIQYCP